MIFNIFVFQSFLTLVLLFPMMGILLARGLKSNVNKAVLMWMITGIVHGVCEIVTRAAENEFTALIARRIIGLNTVVMCTSLVFIGMAMMKKRFPAWWHIMINGTSVVFLYLNTTNMVVPSNYKTYWGYNWTMGTAGPAWVIYCVGYFVLALLLMFYGFWSETNPTIRKQYGIISIGFAITFIPAGLTDIIFPFFGVNFMPVGTVMFLLTVCVFTYAILKYQLFVISPVMELGANREQKYNLKPGHSYLVVEEGATGKAQKPFIDQVLSGKMGLYITRTNPAIIRAETDLKKTPMIWLTEVAGEGNIDPSRIEELNFSIGKFIEEAESSIILIEGIAYLSTYNEFNLIMRFLRALKDNVATKNSSLIISLDKRNFGEKEYSLIAGEFEELIVS